MYIITFFRASFHHKEPQSIQPKIIMETISENISHIKNKISRAAQAAGRNPSAVKLIGVSKTVSSIQVKQAYVSGIDTFGENKIQEAKQKKKEVGPGPTWHFIGHLQTNKVKYIFDLFDLIHSVDSISLAHEINKRAQFHKKIVNILIQVNLSGEKSKFGVSKKKLPDLIKGIGLYNHICIKGLMTIPPYSDEPEKSRPYYRDLFHLQKEIGKLDQENLKNTELSMGMSNDFTVAVEEGSTLVRVGSAIFGERTYDD